MQGFCLGQVISGVIKGALLAIIAAVIGYLMFGLDAGFVWFLVAGVVISCIAILGNVVQLVLGLIAGTILYLFSSWVQFPPREFVNLLEKNLYQSFDDPQKAAAALVTAGIFIVGLFIAVILFYFFGPGPSDENALIIISLVVGAVAGLIVFFFHGSPPDSQVVTTFAITGGIIGFLSGLLPGNPIM